MVHNYMMCALLGQGSYGKVHEGIDITTGRRVAVKAIQRDKVKKVKGALQAVEQEIMIMRQLCGRRFGKACSTHAGIRDSDPDDELYALQLYDVIRTPKVIYIVMERAFGTLDALLDCQVNRVLPLETTQFVFRQLMLGVEWLHARGVIHKDLKPSNIMISLSGGVKLVDFGVSEVLSLYSKSNTCHSSQGTPMFQAPEVVSGKPFSGPPSDVWSCGVILYLMVTGSLPFNGNGLYQLMQNIKRAEFSMANVPDACRKLVKAMLDKDPTTRMKVDDILYQPWVGRMVPINTLGNPLIWCGSKAALVPHLSTKGFEQFNDDGASDGETAFSGACSMPFGPLSMPVTNEFEMQLNSLQVHSQGINFASMNASRRLVAESSALRKESVGSTGAGQHLPGFADVMTVEDHAHSTLAASPPRLRLGPLGLPAAAASHPLPPSSQHTAPLSGALSAIFHTEYFHFPQSASFSTALDRPGREPKDPKGKLLLKLKAAKTSNPLLPAAHVFGTMTMDDALLGQRPESPKPTGQRSFVRFSGHPNGNGKLSLAGDAAADSLPPAGSSNYGGAGAADDLPSPPKHFRLSGAGARSAPGASTTSARPGETVSSHGAEDGAPETAVSYFRPRSQSHPMVGTGPVAGPAEHFIEVEAEEEHPPEEYSGYHSMAEVLPTSGLLIRPTHHFQAAISDVMVSTEPMGQDHSVQNFVTCGTKANERLLMPSDVNVEAVIKAILAGKTNREYRCSKAMRTILDNLKGGGCIHVACTDRDHIFSPSPIDLNVAICPIMRANSRLLFIAYLQRLSHAQPPDPAPDAGAGPPSPTSPPADDPSTTCQFCAVM
eukprot:EG_transcript_1569